MLVAYLWCCAKLLPRFQVGALESRTVRVTNRNASILDLLLGCLATYWTVSCICDMSSESIVEE